MLHRKKKKQKKKGTSNGKKDRKGRGESIKSTALVEFSLEKGRHNKHFKSVLVEKL